MQEREPKGGVATIIQFNCAHLALEQFVRVKCRTDLNKRERERERECALKLRIRRTKMTFVKRPGTEKTQPTNGWREGERGRERER